MADKSTLERKTFKPYSVIFTEGDAADAAYLLVNGRVQIRKNPLSDYPVVLAELGRGDIFGEMALFDGNPRLAEAFAVSQSEVIVVRKEDFFSRLEGMDPSIKSIVFFMMQRIRKMAGEFSTKGSDG